MQRPDPQPPTDPDQAVHHGGRRGVLLLLREVCSDRVRLQVEAKAEVLKNGLAKKGIRELVEEATGYREDDDQLGIAAFLRLTRLPLAAS